MSNCLVSSFEPLHPNHYSLAGGTSGVQGSSDLGKVLLKGSVWVSSDGEGDRLWECPALAGSPWRAFLAGGLLAAYCSLGLHSHMPLCFCNNERVRQGSLFWGVEGNYPSTQVPAQTKTYSWCLLGPRKTSTFYKVKSLNGRKQ